MSTDLRDTLTRADTCEGAVFHDGDMDCCNKPATTIIDARDLDDGDYWAACTWHAHRYGRSHVVPLTELRQVLARDCGLVVHTGGGFTRGPCQVPGDHRTHTEHRDEQGVWS